MKNFTLVFPGYNEHQNGECVQYMDTDAKSAGSLWSTEYTPGVSENT